MSPACRFQMNIHIKSICFLDCIFLYQQQQCNILLTRSVVCGWLARLRKMTQQKSHCDDFQDSCHRIGLWKKKPIFWMFQLSKTLASKNNPKQLLVNAFHLFTWITHWFLQVFDSLSNNCQLYRDWCQFRPEFSGLSFLNIERDYGPVLPYLIQSSAKHWQSKHWQFFNFSRNLKKTILYRDPSAGGTGRKWASHLDKICFPQ